MKAFFRLLGLEDREMLTFLIKLHNTMNSTEFERVPVSERAIFMPQCLRSSRCPAHLTPEGLKCQGCGQCEVSEARVLLEKMGYRIFLVPGSSFIKRMVKKYRPKAILGIGCLAEVKEGIDMADKMGLVVMGVVTLRGVRGNGCQLGGYLRCGSPRDRPRINSRGPSYSCRLISRSLSCRGRRSFPHSSRRQRSRPVGG